MKHGQSGTRHGSGERGLEGLVEAVKRARARRSAMARRKRVEVWALLAVGLVVFGAAVWPFVRAHLQAVAVLKIVGGQPVPWIVGEVVAEPITTEDLRFDIAAAGGTKQSVRARMYLPQNARMQHEGPALLVLHGVHHLGIDEPRLEAFAAAMASCGIRVLTPELPDIKDYHVDHDSVRTIGESAAWFAAKTGGPVGVMGLSFSGGLALVAAADPAYAKSFRFVVAVGAQDSMVRVAEYYRTGEDARPDGSVERLAAHPYGPLVLEYEYLEDFVPSADVPAMRAVLRANLYEDKAAEKTAMAALDPAEQAEAARLLDSTSVGTRALIEASNRKHRDELEELSPDERLGAVRVPVYLLHGEADNIIPSAETLWLERGLPPASLQAALVSPVLSHIDFESARPTAWDTWRLVHFFALVMDAAEKKR